MRCLAYHLEYAHEEVQGLCRSSAYWAVIIGAARDRQAFPSAYFVLQASSCIKCVGVRRHAVCALIQMSHGPAALREVLLVILEAHAEEDQHPQAD